MIFLQLIKPQKTTKKIYGIIKLIGNAVKSKLIFNGRGIAFDRSGSWSFGNDFAENVVSFADVNAFSTFTNNQNT